MRITLEEAVMLRLLEQAAEKPSEEVTDAADQMASLNSQMQGLVGDTLSATDKKKDESVAAMAVGLLVGLPGLLHLMSKMASLAAKMLNKVGAKLDPKKEGETFHHWAAKMRTFYVQTLLVPVVKRIFKKQVGDNPKKAIMYAEVLYAVLLAAVAINAGVELVSHAMAGGADFVIAYEAAHSAETGLSSVGIMNGLRAGFAAIGEVGVMAEMGATAAEA